MVSKSVCRCVDQRSQSTIVSTSFPAAHSNVRNSNIGTVMTVGSDADDEDYILLPPVNLKNLCARHWSIGVNSELERRNFSTVVVISDSDNCWSGCAVHYIEYHDSSVCQFSLAHLSVDCILCDYTYAAHQFQWHSRDVSFNFDHRHLTSFLTFNLFIALTSY